MLGKTWMKERSGPGSLISGLWCLAIPLLFAHQKMPPWGPLACPPGSPGLWAPVSAAGCSFINLRAHTCEQTFCIISASNYKDRSSTKSSTRSSTRSSSSHSSGFRLQRCWNSWPYSWIHLFATKTQRNITFKIKVCKQTILWHKASDSSAAAFWQLVRFCWFNWSVNLICSSEPNSSRCSPSKMSPQGLSCSVFCLWKPTGAQM